MEEQFDIVKKIESRIIFETENIDKTFRNCVDEEDISEEDVSSDSETEDSNCVTQ